MYCGGVLCRKLVIINSRDKRYWVSLQQCNPGLGVRDLKLKMTHIVYCLLLHSIWLQGVLSWAWWAGGQSRRMGGKNFVHSIAQSLVHRIIYNLCDIVVVHGDVSLGFQPSTFWRYGLLSWTWKNICPIQCSAPSIGSRGGKKSMEAFGHRYYCSPGAITVCGVSMV